MLPEIPSLTVEPLSRLEDFERLQPEWLMLWQSCAHATPFQLPQWLLPWWKHLGSGKLCGCAVRDGGRLVAIAPLYVDQGVIRLIGTFHSDILDMLIGPEHEEIYLGAILDFMAGSRDWDQCEFHQLPPESPLLMASPSWLSCCQVCPQELCPVVRLPANCPSLEAAVPPRLAEKLDLYRGRAEAEGDFRIDRIGPESLDEFAEALVRLHGERWLARDRNGVLADERVIAFHREVIPEMHKAEMLRMYAARMNGAIVGIYYGFSDGRRAYAYLGGFDPKYDFMAPGALLISAAIGDAVRDCVVEFDFLRGQEAHQYEWGAKDRPHYILCWQRRS